MLTDILFTHHTVRVLSFGLIAHSTTHWESCCLAQITHQMVRVLALIWPDHPLHHTHWEWESCCLAQITHHMVRVLAVIWPDQPLHHTLRVLLFDPEHPPHGESSVIWPRSYTPPHDELPPTVWPTDNPLHHRLMIMLWTNWMERSYFVRSPGSTNHKDLNWYCRLIYILLLLSIYAYGNKL